jgi:hypothetical protein
MPEPLGWQSPSASVQDWAKPASSRVRARVLVCRINTVGNAEHAGHATFTHQKIGRDGLSQELRGLLNGLARGKGPNK